METLHEKSEKSRAAKNDEAQEPNPLTEDALSQVAGGSSLNKGYLPMNQSLTCDHRERNTCSVPRSVCNGSPDFNGNKSYADKCHKFINEYQPKKPIY